MDGRLSKVEQEMQDLKKKYSELYKLIATKVERKAASFTSKADTPSEPISHEEH